MKLTKQGIRDLNSLPSKPAGKKLPEPPISVSCKHKNKTEHLYYMTCNDCGESFDVDWNPGR